MHTLHCDCRGSYLHFADEAERSRRDVGLLRRALEEIAEHDPIENALDPQWAARIASEALSHPMCASFVEPS